MPERKGAAKSLFSSEKNEKRKTEFDLLRSNRYLLAKHYKLGLNILKTYWINISCLEQRTLHILLDLSTLSKTNVRLKRD